MCRPHLPRTPWKWQLEQNRAKRGPKCACVQDLSDPWCSSCGFLHTHRRIWYDATAAAPAAYSPRALGCHDEPVCPLRGIAMGQNSCCVEPGICAGFWHSMRHERFYYLSPEEEAFADFAKIYRLQPRPTRPTGQ